VFLYVSEAQARVIPMPCKHVNAECHWNHSQHDCCPGLECNYWKGIFKKRYKCAVKVTPTATPTRIPTETPKPTDTPCPSLTPTPTEVPEPTSSPEPTVTLEPTVEPTPVVTEAPIVVKHHTPNPVAPLCQDSIPTGVNDIWVTNEVFNDGLLTVRWGTNPNYGKVNIIYTDTTPGDWKYGIWGTDNDGIERIGELTNGTHYWFAVQYVNGCSQGEWSDAFDPLP